MVDNAPKILPIHNIVVSFTIVLLVSQTVLFYLIRVVQPVVKVFRMKFFVVPHAWEWTFRWLSTCPEGIESEPDQARGPAGKLRRCHGSEYGAQTIWYAHLMIVIVGMLNHNV